MDFKYGEDKVLDALRAYIEATYGEHYARNQKVQLIDVFAQMGDAEAFYKTNVMKYIYRYGKKDGRRNDRDLMKAMHYLVLLYSLNHPTKSENSINVPTGGGYISLQTKGQVNNG